MVTDMVRYVVFGKESGRGSDYRSGIFLMRNQAFLSSSVFNHDREDFGVGGRAVNCGLSPLSKTLRSAFAQRRPLRQQP